MKAFRRAPGVAGLVDLLGLAGSLAGGRLLDPSGPRDLSD
jgi:hypothetical protein